MLKQFHTFLTQFPRAKTARQRVITVDTLLHGFHWYYKTNLPTRPVAINLIEGRLHEVISFLDALSYGEDVGAAIVTNRLQWRRNLQNETIKTKSGYNGFIIMDKTESFVPNYTHIAKVLKNEKPARLPIYEHIISPNIMERILDCRFAALIEGNAADKGQYFRTYCAFFSQMTYDVVSYEVCITEALPPGGALRGGKPGPIQNRSDFEKFPWKDIPDRFWDLATPRLNALTDSLPEGMKVIGGVGNGAFEISEDLVGLEYLPFMQADDPELYADLYAQIGDTMSAIWIEFLRRYRHAFVACRFGDDLGFKSSLLTNPKTLREYVFPQYKKIIDMVHSSGLPFLLHSCGNIFEVMADLLHMGIDAKHSNEDAIAPFDRWINDYGTSIGLFGGFDMDCLCAKSEVEVYEIVLVQGMRFRASARGYALGSGNSIPDYVPVENYLAMIRAAQELRKRET